MEINLNKMATETRNPRSMSLSKLSSLEIATLMNEEDLEVIKAIKKSLKEIAKTIDLAVSTIKNGGRVIYIGAGTSGRLGVLDASECPPTFGVSDNVFIGLIAGGDIALRKAVEGAEDSLTLAEEDLKKINLTKKDFVIGLAASGRTPYVIGGLKYAHKIGAHTGSVSCNYNAEVSNYADIAIEASPGPEVLTGSTRLKSGTTQKLICNMISTATMVQLGKAYSNLMVDVVPSNEKLVARAEKIVMLATECDNKTAKEALNKCGYRAKVAIVMILTNCDAKIAEAKLDKAEGHIEKAIAK